MKYDKSRSIGVNPVYWKMVLVLLGVISLFLVGGCSIPEPEPHHVSKKQAKIAIEEYGGVISTRDAYDRVFGSKEPEASNSSEKQIASAHAVKQKEAEKEAKLKRDEERYRITTEEYGGVIATKEAYHNVFDNDSNEYSAYDSNGKKTDEERYGIAVEEYGGVISTPEAYQRVFGDD